VADCRECNASVPAAGGRMASAQGAALTLDKIASKTVSKTVSKTSRRPSRRFGAFRLAKIPAAARRFLRAVPVLALLALTGIMPGAGVAAEQAFVTIGTGGVTGVYYPSGGATCKIVNLGRATHGVRCSVETTSGSIANIEKLRKGEIDFGYVQADWQFHAFHGSSVFEEAGPFNGLRAVFALHTETATVVVREASGFRSFSDLKQARINVGSSGSGSAASWSVLIDRLGWSAADRKDLAGYKTSELADALCSGEIDAFFAMIGHPAGLIEETGQRCPVRLIGIEGDELDRLVEETPYFIPAVIPADLYGLAAPVRSFGVVATFVTSERMPDAVVATMVEAVLENFDSFRQLHPALNGLTAGDLAGRGMAAPLHPGALTLYRELGLLPAEASDREE
jgi:TRAP transporter TAXI family solute receptor